jgi:hypothetical protein
VCVHSVVVPSYTHHVIMRNLLRIVPRCWLRVLNSKYHGSHEILETTNNIVGTKVNGGRGEKSRCMGRFMKYNNF